MLATSAHSLQHPGEKDRIGASEAAHTYHSVTHRLSYSSTDCRFKLDGVLLSDSNVVKKIHFCRMKAEMTTTNVLGLNMAEYFGWSVSTRSWARVFFCSIRCLEQRKDGFSVWHRVAWNSASHLNPIASSSRWKVASSHLLHQVTRGDLSCRLFRMKKKQMQQRFLSRHECGFGGNKALHHRRL